MCDQNRSNPGQKCCGACRKRTAPPAEAAPQPPARRESFLQARPWIWIVVAWVFLIAVMSTVVTIAVKNSPQPIPVAAQYGH